MPLEARSPSTPPAIEPTTRYGLRPQYSGNASLRLQPRIANAPFGPSAARSPWADGGRLADGRRSSAASGGLRRGRAVCGGPRRLAAAPATPGGLRRSAVGAGRPAVTPGLPAAALGRPAGNLWENARRRLAIPALDAGGNPLYPRGFPPHFRLSQRSRRETGRLPVCQVVQLPFPYAAASDGGSPQGPATAQDRAKDRPIRKDVPI